MCELRNNKNVYQNVTQNFTSAGKGSAGLTYCLLSIKQHWQLDKNNVFTVEVTINILPTAVKNFGVSVFKNSVHSDHSVPAGQSVQQV